MARFYVKAGFNAFGGIEQFIAALAAAAGLTPTDITVEGTDVKRPFNFVNVTDENAAKLAGANVVNAAGEKVVVEVAKPKAEKPPAPAPVVKPAAPPIPKGPVAVKPVQRPATPKAEKPKGPEIRRAVAAPPPRKERRFPPELIEFVVGTYVGFYEELEQEDLEKAERLIRTSDVGVEMAITSVKATLLGDIKSGQLSKNAKLVSSSREALQSFIGEVARLSKKPEKPLATIADGQQAKAKDRGNKGAKAKETRNASPTAEAPAPVPPPSTESTPAAAQQ